jgi:hypothetical protein
MKLEGFREAMQDPALKQQYIANEYNLKIPQIIPIEKKRNEIVDQAFQSIDFDGNEELKERRDQWVVDKLFDESSDGRGSRRYNRRDSEQGAEHVLGVLEDVEPLREAAEVLGHKESGNSSLRDIAQPLGPALIQLFVARQEPGAVPQISSQAPVALPSGQLQPVGRILPVKAEGPPPKEVIKEIHTYTVEVADGLVKNMNPAEYQQWSRSHLRTVEAAPKPTQGVPTRPMQQETQRQQSAQPRSGQKAMECNPSNNILCFLVNDSGRYCFCFIFTSVGRPQPLFTWLPT